MRRLLIGVLVTISVASAGIAAQGRGNGRGNGNRDGAEQPRSDQGGTAVSVQVSFGRDEIALVRTHYGDRYRSLPPGLQKKLARTGTLPPGWQKKLEPFPPALERRLGPIPAGYVRGVYDGNAVIVSLRTGVLLDVAVLF